MELSPSPTPTKSTSKKSTGRFFKINLMAFDTLAARGASAQEAFAMLVLAAGTDASNICTRSGRRAISAALGITRGRAGVTIDRLVAIGAITSLEHNIVDRRNPTASRFNLDALIAERGTSAPGQEVWATVPNALVQNPESAADLRRAVAIGGMDALRTLVEIAADPLGTDWPPRLFGETKTEVVAEFGRFKLVSLENRADMTGAAGMSPERLALAMKTLCHFRLVQMDACHALPGDAGLTLIDPVGTIDQGSFALGGAFGPAATLALMIGHMTDPETRKAPIQLHALGTSGKLLAVMSTDFPDARIILRPRLAMIPAAPDVLDAEALQKSEGMAAARRLLLAIRQHFPDGFAEAKAAFTAIASGKMPSSAYQERSNPPI